MCAHWVRMLTIFLIVGLVRKVKSKKGTDLGLHEGNANIPEWTLIWKHKTKIFSKNLSQKSWFWRDKKNSVYFKIGFWFTPRATGKNSDSFDNVILSQQKWHMRLSTIWFLLTSPASWSHLVLCGLHSSHTESSVSYNHRVPAPGPATCHSIAGKTPSPPLPSLPKASSASLCCLSHP